MIQSEKKYEYGSKWITIVLVILMFGATSVLFFFKAIHNDRGLILNNIVELSENGATIFFWIFFVFSLLFVFAGIIGAYYKLKKKEYLILKSDSVIIPPIGLRRTKTEIRFSDILLIHETQVNKNSILTLKFNGGKRGIASNLLLNKSDYNDIKIIITKKLNEVQQSI